MDCGAHCRAHSAVARRRLHALLAALAGVALGAVHLGAQTPGSDLSGGYVDDATCARCHPELATSYRQMGMARSFGDAATVEPIETYSSAESPEAGRYFHQPSGSWYEMKRSGEGRPVFRRWHLDDDGRPIHEFEAPVDWTLGSGHTSRSYLLHQPGGELFVLPVAWYTQGASWRMAPGFDSAGHMGLLRRVQRECMFCHNAYPPDILGRPDSFADPHLFPTGLPHGTGCQRCHGPGRDHVEAAYLGGLDDAVSRSIVNPGRLSPKLRDDVCEQCHLQPSVALMPVRRFGRRVYDYRPGTDLDEYIVYFDPVEEGWDREDRFEINHHPYRLRQSACFVESRAETAADGLSCLTCHDPHRKVPPAQRAEHYRQACRSCHPVDACGLAAMTAAGDGTDPELPLHMRGVDPQNCVGCHMPKRRTRDVVHVAMTDHRIARLPGGEDPDASLLAPREEFTPTLVDMDFYLPEAAPNGVPGEVYQAFGVELIGGNESSFAHLGQSLVRSELAATEPWLQLARGFLRRGQTGDLHQALGRVLAEDPDNVRALTWLGLSKAQTDLGAAIGDLERARDASRFEDPNLLYNLGYLYFRAGRNADALATLGRTVELRPIHSPGWFQLGLLNVRMAQPDAAIAALRTCLSVDPTHSRASRELARLLAARGERDEAIRLLRHDLRRGVDAAESEAVLETLVANGPARSADGTSDGGDGGAGR